MTRPPDTAGEIHHGRPLVVVSNREPCRVRSDASGTPRVEAAGGGLVTALTAALTARDGEWVAWNPRCSLDEAALGRAVRHRLSLVPVSGEEVDGYYNGLANGALWPLCHYALEYCRFRQADWHAYRAVNARFADRLARTAPARAAVWVHDYHLMLLPALFRRHGRHRGPVGYFHHVPFPVADVFRLLPWARELLCGMLGADLVGFHTRGYARNFLRACAHELGAAVDFERGAVDWNGRRVQVGAFPVGVDARAFARHGARPEVEQAAGAIRRTLGAARLVLGVDRLDYTKGIPQRISVLECLLRERPELCGRVSLLQIAVPSRTELPAYRALRAQVKAAAARVNAEFGTDRWQPVTCVFASLPHRRLAGFYRAADVALVTPLFDGMNLVAKEFCATRVDGDGVLVLSESAGAAECLGAAALTVNPFDIEGMAAALASALEMPAAQRRSRMRELREVVGRHDVHRWLDSFLAAAESAFADARRGRTATAARGGRRLAWRGGPRLAGTTPAPLARHPDG